MLSFLGFDAISTMAEETKGGVRVVGRATVISLGIIAVLFVVQTYLASLLLPGLTEFEGETATNEAFYTVASLVGNGWFKVVVAVAVALGSAVANAMVAQAATSRLLFSMARDRQLPRFLAHVHPTRKVPERAVLLVSVVSLVLALFFVGQVALLSSLVNFGALFSFLMLHVTVIAWFMVKQRERNFGLHLAVPVLGFLIIGYVLVNADANAKIGGLVWIAVGVVVLLVFRATGRTTDLKVH